MHEKSPRLLKASELIQPLAPPRRPKSEFALRPGIAADARSLLALEHRAFTTDRISRRGFGRFLQSDRSALIVAESDGALAGYALVLFRERSLIARLYSIAVEPGMSGRGIGSALLAQAEQAAIERQRTAMRLEVHEKNDAAVTRYRKAGYQQFGRHPGYYGDGGDALRLEKRLHPKLLSLQKLPPYFHQTTEFTCAAACMMMALATAKPSWTPAPTTEYELWREATTIFTGGGPGGCGPFGIAVALRRRGLHPEIYVNNPGPHFLDTVVSKEKHRVMRVTQAAFRREAEGLGVPTHLTAGDHAALVLSKLSAGNVAIVLVSGYHLFRSKVPHWVFAFGYEDRYVLMHDPWAQTDEQGLSRVTHVASRGEFQRMTRVGRDRLQAAILIPKGR
jgi:ribosomal protein S18 acetylase RimI-like enzyme